MTRYAQRAAIDEHTMDDSDDYQLDTKLTHLGNRPHDNHGVVNPPVYHASTILFPTVAAMEAARTQRFGPGTRYGRYGTPTTFALEEALAGIEGGHRAMVLPSGLAAISTWGSNADRHRKSY